MCQIIIKPRGLLTNIENLDRAKERNKDGFGVMWFDEESQKVITAKTLDYNEFKIYITHRVKDSSAVIHLRFASRGKISLDNVHPFRTSKGAYLCHNGTLTSWGNDLVSDTKEFADTFEALDIDWEAPATEKLVGHTIGTAYNKIVVMLKNGYVKIFNRELFIEEEGIMYSNTCHQPIKVYSPPTKSYYYDEDYNKKESMYGNLWDDVNDVTHTVKTKETFKIFVYGTLKKGNSNHGYLSDAKFLYKATTVKKWAMVGKGMPFPYILGEHTEGYNIIGEVYEVDEDTKEILDILEGAPSHYIEQEIKVHPIIIVNGLEKIGYSQLPVITYTRSDTTKRPSLINNFNKKDFIEEW